MLPRRTSGSKASGISRACGPQASSPRAEDLTYIFNICNGLDRELRNAGHKRRFYWANRDCWEIDLHSTGLGGADDDWADAVDLFFITTHGNNDAGNAILAYDINVNEWIGNSGNWRLGD